MKLHIDAAEIKKNKLFIEKLNRIGPVMDFVIGAVLTDLSKIFDCIPHYLLIAKLEDYGVGEKLSSYIVILHSSQCVRVNDEKVIFKRYFLVTLKAPINPV